VTQVGEEALHALAGDVLVEGQCALAGGQAGEGVVQHDAGADVPALPDPVLEGVEEGDGADQVRGQLVDEQVAFGQRLVDEVEVEHLQVAQAAVNQLGGPARGSGGPVLGLDDRCGQPAGHRVEGDPGAGHTSADDQDVEGVTLGGSAQHLQGALAGLGGELGGRTGG